MNNNYLPKEAIIEKIESFTPEIKLYTFKLANNQKFEFIPGQFVMVSSLGYGEAPFGIASSPFKKDNFKICVRKVGGVTKALDKLEVGCYSGIRGPYGNGFPLKELEGKDIILAAGGTGIAPIVSLVEYLTTLRPKFGKIYLLYGAKTPSDLLFSSEFKRWSKSIELCLTVNQPDRKWQQKVGLITGLCKIIEVDCQKTKAIMCGPPVMYQAMTSELKKIGIKENNIYVSLERRMRCGIGKCQHCVFGTKYVCQDGPIFKYSEISNLPEEG